MMSHDATPVVTLTQGKSTKVLIDHPLASQHFESRNKTNRIKIKLSTQKMRLIEQEREVSKERMKGMAGAE